MTLTMFRKLRLTRQKTNLTLEFLVPYKPSPKNSFIDKFLFGNNAVFIC